MTDCPENLTAYLDEELPQEEAADVTRHLTACRHCRRRSDRYTALSGLLAGIPEPPEPHQLRKKTHARIDRFYSDPGLWQWWKQLELKWKSVGWAAMAVGFTAGTVMAHVAVGQTLEKVNLNTSTNPATYEAAVLVDEGDIL